MLNYWSNNLFHTQGSSITREWFRNRKGYFDFNVQAVYNGGEQPWRAVFDSSGLQRNGKVVSESLLYIKGLLVQ